eukprot:CAMPEP_0172628516 /NCGR_PEP_ID=MMETSP1068-20121228/162376_1 /TAXON_ID=35684 /ORGANISM="Pseudopedinella elastica, Strain CCMP716" /LENGTH=254 /DNA_ID=CAMNT_0013438763 /DNA_START=304 /DNA_END=1068 /DNA_ORIENTATION=-
MPIVDHVSMRQTVREQVLDIPPQQCYTKDNAPVQADAVCYIQIFDMEAARYQVHDLFTSIMNLVLTQIREEMGQLTLDETFSSRAQINQALLNDVNAVTHIWGVRVTRIELLNIDPSPDLVKAMELQMSAERRKRASILESEGDKINLINQAEGQAAAVIAAAEAQRQSVILAAEATAERSRIEADGLKKAFEILSKAIKETGKSDEEAIDATVSLLMMRAYMETQGRFADSNGTKLLMFPGKETVQDLVKIFK